MKFFYIENWKKNIIVCFLLKTFFKRDIFESKGFYVKQYLESFFGISNEIFLI